jgi:hypothetical protein
MPSFYQPHPDPQVQQLELERWIKEFLGDRTALAEEIRTTGERPVGQHHLTGRVVLRRAQDYDWCTWFVVEDHYLWHCQSHGGPRADGKANNILTDGPGAAGYRLQRTPELDSKLEVLVKRAKELLSFRSG